MIDKKKHRLTQVLRIALLFLLFNATNTCNEPGSGESKKIQKSSSLKNVFGLIMKNDSILAPVVITAKQGKTYPIRWPKGSKINSDYGNSNGFSYMPNLTTADGLALDVITNGDKSCLCDRNGNLWFGTGGGGVSRYDGKSFKNFTTEHGLANNLVWSIIEDKHGNIWFGTNDGVSCYNGNSFINYTLAEGLINNAVRSITEDKFGNLWCCTEGGISRFDGKKFINYTSKDGLPNNIILSSVKDKKGNLWFGTQGGGVIRYQLKNTNITCHANTCKHNLQVPGDFDLHKNEIARDFDVFSTKHGLSFNTVLCIFQDKNENILFGTYGGGVYQFDTKQLNHPCQLKTCKHNLLFKEELNAHTKVISTCIRELNNKIGPSKVINHIAGDSKGNLWFATELGTCCYDQKKFTYFTTEQGLSNDNVSCIVEDKRSNIWLGTFGGGIDLYDGKGIINYRKKKGLVKNFITSILEDKSGTMYFADYDQGLTIFDGKNVSNFELSEVSDNKNISCLFLEKNGILGFGTLGKGICFYDGKKITNYTTAQGLINDNVAYCLKDNKDNLWIATERGVSCFDGRKFINYTTAQGLVHNYVFCIHQDSAGNIWFGTQGGLSCFNGEFFTNYAVKQGLPNNYIYCITEDKYKNLWFSTDAGASRYDRKSFLNFSTTEGLTNNMVTQILVSNEQNIVLGTNKGLGILTAFTRKNLLEKKKEIEGQKHETTIPVINNLSNAKLNLYAPQLEIYNASTGYSINDVNYGCNGMYKDSKGVIWVGTGSDKTGLVRFDYAALNKNLKPLHLKIQNIKINQHGICWYNLIKNKRDNHLPTQQEFLVLEKSLTEEERKNEKLQFGDIKFDSISKFYNLPQKLILPYHLNTITFEYAAIEPARPKLVEYQYMLEGYEKDWAPISNNREVTYVNLSEGVYTFKVRGANQYNVWSKPISYSFTILPPYYRTSWAYCLYLIGSIGIIIGYNYLRNVNSKKLAQLIMRKLDEEKQRISRDLHDDLGQELSYLKMNTETKNKPAIDRILNKLRTISYNLSPVKILDSSIRDLLKELIIEAEKSNLFFSYEIDDVFIKNNEVKINIYRIAQEALSNILKHSKAQNARITLKKLDTFVILEIQDDGMGISNQNNNKAIGISSMKERAKILDANITIEITNKGTKIKLKLKLPSK
jgi:ligand-binding sensor domain-containing protein